jgi:hypothetical protein
VYDTTTSDNTAIVLNADNGFRSRKILEYSGSFTKSLELKDQLSSSYDAATKTYTVLLKMGINVATAIFAGTGIQWLK